MEYSVHDIFTPSSPARINFVERESLNKRIVRALKTKGMQIVIFGHSGSGKTTLLENKLQQVYEQHIKTNCMKGMSFDSILLDAFDQLDSFYINERVKSGKINVDTSVMANFHLIKTQLKATREEGSQTKTKRVIPPQLTGANLARMIGEAKYCWVLEDFHKIDGVDKKKLSQLMKVFMDLSDNYPELKIIAVGAVNTAREVVQFDAEMKRRLAEIYIPLMTDLEIQKIIKNGAKFLNLIVTKDISDDICHHSNGVASICHQLCALMCEELDVYQTLSERDTISFDYSNLTYAVTEYLQLESDTIKRSFDNALKLEDSDDIIYELSRVTQNGVKVESIVEGLNSREIRIEANQVSKILENLLTEKYGELVKYDEDSHRYSFSDPFYKTFSLAYFSQPDSYNKKRISESEKHNILNSAFKSMKRSLSVSQGQVRTL
jgi:Holliday junction resolvasome RuvABC ATP-dependent DNA helicase subunit